MYLPPIEPLDHRDPSVAEQILAVLKLAHAQESRLLGLECDPVGGRTLQDIQESGEFYLGIYRDALLSGAISVGPDEELNQVSITSLTVHPQFLRQGIARSLVTEMLRRLEGIVVSVTTTAENAPALALYRALGFMPYRSGTMDPGGLAVVKLRRARSGPCFTPTCFEPTDQVKP